MDTWRASAISPLPVAEPEEVELPYGLTAEELSPVLPGLESALAGELRAYRSHEKQGTRLEQGAAQSVILTFRYPVGRGRTADVTVFVKEIATDRQTESSHYALMADYGVPTPTLLAAVSRGAGEVLITEFLPTIGIDVTSCVEVEMLLDALARLNAIDVEASAVRHIPGRPRAEMDAMRRDALARLAVDPRLDIDCDAWFTAFERSRDEVIAMPRAFTHGEFAFQQCGWSRGRLVLFDFESVQHRPRLSDLTSIIDPIAIGLGLGRQEVLAIYSDRLVAHGGVGLEPAVALHELRLLRVYGQFSAGFWLGYHEEGSAERLAIAEQVRDDMLATGLLG